MEAAHTFQQSITDGVPEPITVIGTDYHVMLMNRAAREFSFADTGTSTPVFCYQVSHQREGPCNGIEHPCPLKRVRATCVESALFRITQEALTNVAKHARAANVAASVQVAGEIRRLVISDDGIGFDPAPIIEPAGSRGWGLLTMTERAEAVGGCCRIESGPGRGAQVIVEVAR
jgi:hypothetical protein